MTSPAETERVETCESCQATIYPQHLLKGLAGRWAGQLLCTHCLAERKAVDAEAGEDLAAPVTGAGPADHPAGRRHHERPLDPRATGASRVRTFHAKLSDGAVRHMDQQINAWLDHNPDVVVKFASTTVGTWEGKHAEPTLIMTLFY